METMLNIVRRGKDNLLFVDDYIARNPIVDVGHGAEAEG